MLKIWGRPNSSNVAKVMWAVAELGVPHQRTDVSNRVSYLALNPNGLIPAIEDDGFLLWESNAIVRYLAAKHGAGTLWSHDLRVRADADRWMDWAGTTLAGSIASLRDAYKAPDERSDAQRIADVLSKTAGTVGMLDQALASRPYIAGGTLTMGDIALGSLVHRWFVAPLDKPKMPGLAGWYDRMKARPHFVTHIAEAVR